MTWTAILSPKDFGSQIIDEHGEVIADELSRSQATMMAAANELLDSLQQTVERVKYFHGTTPTHLVGDCFTCGVIVKAEAAIAKAEGRGI